MVVNPFCNRLDGNCYCSCAWRAAGEDELINDYGLECSAFQCNGDGGRREEEIVQTAIPGGLGATTITVGAVREKGQVVHEIYMDLARQILVRTPS